MNRQTSFMILIFDNLNGNISNNPVFDHQINCMFKRVTWKTTFMQICAIKLSETVETVDYTNKKCFFLQNKCVNI